MTAVKRWSKTMCRIRNSTPFWRCISLSKDVVLKKSFFCVIILALVLCLIIYSRSVFNSGYGHPYFQSKIHWRHLVSNISEKATAVSSKLINKFPFLSDSDDDYELDTDYPSDTPFETSTESFDKKIDDYTEDLDLRDLRLNNKRQYLIYLCDDTAWCGGWGDRQRGVVSLYLLSLAYNRSFGIRMTSPCDLEQFYEPNDIPWIVNESDIQNKSSRVIYSIDSKPSVIVGKPNTLKEDVIFIQTNVDNIRIVTKRFKEKMPKFVLNENRPVIFRQIWQQLMKPKPRLQKRLNDLIYSGSMDGSLVCAHVRIGYSKTLPNDPSRLELSSVETVWRFMETFKNVRKYFVATDNDDVRKSARERFGRLYVDTGGTILHIDRQRKQEAACEGFETAILDQLILTKCDILVISKSNFSIRGAMLKTVVRNIFIFDGTTIKPYNLMSHFRRRQHSVSHIGMKARSKLLNRVRKK